MNQPAHRVSAAVIDPRVETTVRYAAAIGAVLVLLLPAARGFSETFGWLPLWLLAMPLTAWWALHRFHLPQRAAQARNEPQRRRRPGAQARRRARPPIRPALPRAA
jgi:hypothetical protein